MANNKACEGAETTLHLLVGRVDLEECKHCHCKVPYNLTDDSEYGFRAKCRKGFEYQHKLRLEAIR